MSEEIQNDIFANSYRPANTTRFRMSKNSRWSMMDGDLVFLLGFIASFAFVIFLWVSGYLESIPQVGINIIVVAIIAMTLCLISLVAFRHPKKSFSEPDIISYKLCKAACAEPPQCHCPPEHEFTSKVANAPEWMRRYFKKEGER